MKKNLRHTLTAISSVGLTVAINVIPLTRPASAETLARAQGRCKLTTSSKYLLFDGHCTVKQKQQGGTTVFVVDLDDDSTYRFSGPNKQALQVETHDKVHNVSFIENPDKGVFSWVDRDERYNLSVKLDSQHPPNVSHDSTGKSIGIALAGAAVGALIGSLLSGGSGGKSTQASTTSSNVRVGEEVPALSDLIGARSGQAEGTLVRRGYVWQNGTQQADSALSNYTESRTGNCVSTRVTDGRYAAIVYAPKENCR